MEVTNESTLNKGRIFFLLVVVAIFIGYFSIRFFLRDDITQSATPVGAQDESSEEIVSDSNIEIAPISSSDHIRGISRPQIVVIEFSDFDCPYCASFHETMKSVVENYQGRVTWVFRHFPISQIHPEAQAKAEGAECASALGGNETFWNFADYLFLHQDMTPSQLPFVAQNFGLDAQVFASCLGSGRYSVRVNNDRAQAVAAGGFGTPYSIILYQDQKIPLRGDVSYDTLSEIIDSLIGNTP